MQSFPINWWAVLLAAGIKFVLGALWYSPALFGKQWMAAAKLSEAELRAGMGPAIAVEIVADLIAAFILLHAVHYAGAVSLWQGGLVGFFNWAGFVATFTLGQVFYERRPWSLFAFANGYWALSLILMGAILAIWP